MKLKKHHYIINIIIVLAITASVFMVLTTNNCNTLEDRELRLREISKLGVSTNIDQEIVINGYIISGYTTKNNKYGLAVFEPMGSGKYRFQTNTNRYNDDLAYSTIWFNEEKYNIF